MRTPSRRALAALGLAAASGVCRGALLADSTLGLNEVAFSREPTQVYIGSPSLLRVRGSRELLVSADRFGDGFAGQPRNASLYRAAFAADGASLVGPGGGTFEPLGWVPDQYWSNLWQLEGPGTDRDVFLLGTATDGPAPVKVSRSRDGGNMWLPEDSAVLFGEVNGNSSYETGPTPVVEVGGRVFRAFERLRPPFDWGVDYEAVIAHAPADSDAVTDPTAWTVTPPLPFDPAWCDGAFARGRPPPSRPGFLEGNAVLGPDGETVFNLLRFSPDPRDPANLPYLWVRSQASSPLASPRGVSFELLACGRRHTMFEFGRAPRPVTLFTYRVTRRCSSR